MTRHLRSTLPLALLGITVLAVPLACGGSEKPPTTATNPPPSATPPGATATPSAAPTGPTGGTASATPSASASVPSLSDILTTDPAKVQQIAAAAGSAAAAMLQAPGTLPTVETGLNATAAKTAPGMQAEGQLAQGDLKEGEHVTMMVTLQPGKCYAIVGYSPAVKDLDLRLLAPPFYTLLAGEDVTDDNAPTIGKAPNPMCPIIPVGIPYKVDIAAEKGAGKVGVMLFSKPNPKK